MFLVFFLDVVNVLLFLGFRNLSQREKPLIELIDFFGCQTVRLCFFIFKKFGKAVTLQRQGSSQELLVMCRRGAL